MIRQEQKIRTAAVSLRDKTPTMSEVLQDYPPEYNATTWCERAKTSARFLPVPAVAAPQVVCIPINLEALRRKFVNILALDMAIGTISMISIQAIQFTKRLTMESNSLLLRLC